MGIPQIEPVTGLSRDYRSIFAKLGKGPVFLAQRSKPAAVLLSLNEYERLVTRLQRYELLSEAKRIAARIDSGEEKTISHEELKRLMLEKSQQGVSDNGSTAVLGA